MTKLEKKCKIMHNCTEANLINSGLFKIQFDL
jgi:hypothetical protein